MSDHIIQERNSTHGDFDKNALISQAIKDILRTGDMWQGMTDVQKEAAEMIALKLSRIVSGNPDEPDHVRDIAGYARLYELELLKSKSTGKHDIKFSV